MFFLRAFERVFQVFYSITKLRKYRVGQNWDADEFKNRTLSLTLQKKNMIKKYGIFKKKQKKKLKAFQNIVTIFKINSIDFKFFLFLHLGLLGFVVIAY